jgi:HEAT repeat protein
MVGTHKLETIIQDMPRIEGIKKMGDILGRKAFEYLVINLWDENKWVRIAAASSLAELKDTRADHFLAMHMNDADKDVRSTVSTSLGIIRDGNPVRPPGPDQGVLQTGGLT